MEGARSSTGAPLLDCKEATPGARASVRLAGLPSELDTVNGRSVVLPGLKTTSANGASCKTDALGADLVIQTREK